VTFSRATVVFVPVKYSFSVRLFFFPPLLWVMASFSSWRRSFPRGNLWPFSLGSWLAWPAAAPFPFVFTCRILFLSAFLRFAVTDVCFEALFPRRPPPSFSGRSGFSRFYDVRLANLCLSNLAHAGASSIQRAPRVEFAFYSLYLFFARPYSFFTAWIICLYGRSPLGGRES